MQKTPYIAKVYLLLAAFFIALPTIGTKFYKGQTGKFLVASENVRYEPFRESVIYITHHSVFGAYGFVINKPIDLERLKQAYADVPDNVEDLRIGGPVGLYDDSFAIYASLPQEPKIDWEIDAKLPLKEVIARVDRQPYKQVFIGFSGWGPLQLEMEIVRGTWNVVEANPAVIFEDKETLDIWRELKSLRTTDRYEDQKI